MSVQRPSGDESTAYRPPEDTPTVIIDAQVARALQLTPGTILGGRYRIVSLIGKGGMGEVYRADDLKLGQTVALKFLSHRAAAERLYEEVRIGRQVSHPNVCRLYDIAEVDGQLFITMEFVDGEDLASLLRRIGRLPAEKALAVSRDICAGVAAAHEKNVIHRDLKPANVMVDGRGRGRVTDFGLAFADGTAKDSSGTPAYMAPEQLAGETASVKSDIYALGLVLYEIFTGLRTFETTSTHDLLVRQQRCDFTRPSAVTHDIPAVVERVILRCLDARPSARPDSVHDILRELPGGDPLAAAIAAGETPSPAMVAAAGRSGELSAPVAWSLFALVIAGLAAAAVISGRTMLYRQTDLKAPDVLQEHARSIIATAGLNDPPADSELDVVKQLDVMKQLGGQRIVAIYRQSPWPMRPRNPEGRLRFDDPPLEQGMANVDLDSSGRLLEMTIAPPRVDETKTRGEPNWTPFIAAAGFDRGSLAPVAPQWSAPVDSDTKSAWLAKDGRRIEAAAYHGKPVWFSVMSGDTYALARAPISKPLADRIAFVMFVFFMISVPIAALLLAQRNLRRRQGDRAAAFRLACFFFIVMFVASLFRAHHPMSFVDEWMITSWLVAQATFWGLITGVCYIAVEPYVRRRWPEMLISWSRLMSGRFRDPMIGRDLLVGAAGAIVGTLLWHGSVLVSEAMGAKAPLLQPVATSLGPARHVVFYLTYSVGEALLRGVGFVTLVLVLRAIVRNTAIAAAIGGAMVATMSLGDSTGPFAVRAAFAVCAVAIALLLMYRFGLLALISFAFFVLVLRRLPLTLDPTVWYFGRSAIVLLCLIALAAYAFRISIGSKPWLPRLALD